MTTQNIINAAPLCLTPLSQQIKEAGGEGFNCDVKVTPIKGSFSSIYTFQTAEGEKSIKTVNDYQVGVLTAEEKHLIRFNADKKEYTLVTRREIKKAPYKTLLVKPLGSSFDEMIDELNKMYPNRFAWSFENPELILQAR